MSQLNGKGLLHSRYDVLLSSAVAPEPLSLRVSRARADSLMPSHFRVSKM